ncbi:MAG: BamA/TamA family outer membrane protein [Gemmatimonadetes bacterium]|nr:BamA/TamA family outer membrane protein [Gemmatimonadota bacterium]
MRLLVAFLLPLPLARAAAQGPPADTVVVAPGPEYRAGWLHQLLFGRHYRGLWVEPIPAPVLDLGAFAGGLVPVRRGGGRQTKSLRLRAPDGREYVFRSIDKDPAAALPEPLRRTIAGRVLQDQISSGHPAAPLVAAPLLDAAGILHADPILAFLPDDARLGDFRAEFGNMLGIIEERPDEGDGDAPGWGGFTRIVGSERLLERLQESPKDRLDAGAFLTARLVDMWLGDWDRHPDQWRWAVIQRGGTRRWLPIPRDRDQAFVRLDGILPGLARYSRPQLQSFGRDFPSISGLTWSGRQMDRRFLVQLGWPQWDSVVRDLDERLTDSAVAVAVGQSPTPYLAIDSARLASALRNRRTGLPKAARRFYLQLAREPDIHATDRPEVAQLHRDADGSVEVVLRATGNDQPYFARRFDPAETREVRLYLHGGDDSAVLTGAGPDRITLRVIGGGGDDVLRDATAVGGVRFYDDRGRTRVKLGPASRLDERRWRPLRASPGPDGAGAWRDWGDRWLPVPWITFGPDLGLFLGGGASYQRFGFRREPYAWRARLRAGYATGAARPRVEFDADRRAENGPLVYTVAARASGIETIRFYGLGNATPGGPTDAFKVRQTQITVRPAVGIVTAGASVTVGPVLSYAKTDLLAGTLLERTRPYGTEPFGQLGARLEFSMDTRDTTAAATQGALGRLGTSVYPAVLDVESPFGEIHGEMATFLSAAGALQPTLALRIGGKKVWGDFPFHEAAFLGGAGSVRGLAEQRFAGTAAAWGNAELRVALGRFFMVLPGRFGVFGLTDAGRVWASGEASRTWHTGVGGGVWFAFLSSANTISAAVVRSAERNGVYVRAGFAY